MFRHNLSVAFRHLGRNWLYAGITILGLAAAFAAAILIGLYVRDEHSFERFISGHEQIYRLETDVLAAEPVRGDTSAGSAAAYLALDFPELEGVVRLARSSRWAGRDKAETWERVAWTDPDFFKVLPYPVFAGDPIAALHDPNGLVLTREVARKYFGVDAPIGETLLILAPDGDDALSTTPHPMSVRAVLEDIPRQTHLEQFKVFAPLNAAWANRAPDDRLFYWTYARLPPGMSVDRIQEELAAFATRHYLDGWRFRLEPLKDVHFEFDGRAVVRQIGIVGLLIIVIAAINFVTLMTARALRRAIEVRVRKAIGASRRDLIVQFMGEALLYVFAAALLGMTMAGLALPAANAFLERSIVFDFLNDPKLVLGILGTALLTGLIAGVYPALVLSNFAPAPALKGARGQWTGSTAVRQGLVVAQFAVLIVLVIGTATIYRQTSFALENVLRLNGDQVVLMDCEPGFKQKVAALPGVDAAACCSYEALGAVGMDTETLVKDPVRGEIPINTAAADVGFFEMHGLQPLAGRFFSADRGEDLVLDGPNAGPQDQPSVVLNESAVRHLGFDSPQNAAGKFIDWIRPYAAPAEAQPSFRSSHIIGVVRDFTLTGSVRTAVEPTMYFVDPTSTFFLSAKVQGRRLPETLQSIDALWRSAGHVRPIKFEFLGEIMRSWYRNMQIQGGIIGASAGLAIVIACLGLFALAAFTAERRTKEIGVRKAMGASRFEVVRLLLWQFTKPVLTANVVAWPIAYWATASWLEGFAYRVSLPAWLFLFASIVAVLIAWASVAVKAWQAANAQPATALQFE